MIGDNICTYTVDDIRSNAAIILGDDSDDVIMVDLWI